MEPRIGYVNSRDGTMIAYACIGEGPPLVRLWPIVSNVARDWVHYPEVQKRWAETHRLISINRRGSGMSQRQAEHSLEAWVEDIEAVFEALELREAILMGSFVSGAPAIAFAARHPALVGRLILHSTWARGMDYVQSPTMRSVLGALAGDWQWFTEAFAQWARGWGKEGGPEAAAGYRRNLSQDDLTRAYTAVGEADVSDLVTGIACPTLIVHDTEWIIDLRGQQWLAAHIRGSRLVAVATGLQGFWSPEVEASIRSFLADTGGVPESKREAFTAPSPSPFRTILFTDIEGHTGMMQRLGDARGRELLREHERLTREAIQASGGAEVKTMGDGFMASFGSAQKALECAIAVQQAFALDGTPLAAEGLRVRVGINAGEPIEEESDLFGHSVIAAARIAALAGGGEIVVSDVVRQLVAGKGFLFADRGEVFLRGLEDPVRLHDLRWQATAD